MTCSVCSHEKFAEIDAALVSGEKPWSIAARFQLSRSSVQRHRKCISAALQRKADMPALTARGVIEKLVRKLERLADDCETERDREMFLRTSDRLTRAAETFGKLNGEIQAASVQAFLAALGVQTEAEVREALHLKRSAAQPSLEECREEAVALLRMVMAERPEWRAGIMAQLESVAVVLEPVDSASRSVAAS
ncbi:MAG: hypothetical protein ACT4PE_05475 [Candidatus Eiseniibacteriota bacterium]